jgi:hypothetical protein
MRPAGRFSNEVAPAMVVLCSLCVGSMAGLVACSLNDRGLGSSEGAGGARPAVGGAGGNSAGSGEAPIASSGAGGASGALAGAGGGTVHPGIGGAVGATGVAGSAADGADAGADSGPTGGNGGGIAGAQGTDGGIGVDALDVPQPAVVGCADGTREGFLDQTKYPLIAACAGGWDTPGLLSNASHVPQCGLQAGNDGANPSGQRCSAADLCAAGWHVCESASEVLMRGTSCEDAVPPGVAGMLFFVTRQRGDGQQCPDTNDTGTNNLYGCGNFGSAPDSSCSPLTRMLHDSDCLAHPPWACSEPHVTGSQKEYLLVTKGSDATGGVICCHD